MIKLNKITYGFLYVMLFSPILAYILSGALGLRSIMFYFKVFTVLYGVFFLSVNPKKIRIPNFAILTLLFVGYLFIWTFFNGDFERRGLFAILLNNIHLAIFFIIIIIYNTNFSKSFIQKTKKIFKITVLLAAIVSIIQIFDTNFLNAWSYWNPERGATYLLGDIYTHRRSSIFGFIDQNSLGLSFIPLLAVLVGYMLYVKDKKYYIYLILGGLTALLSNSRYVMAGFLIITFIILVVQKVKITGFFKYAFVLFVIGFLLYQALFFFGYDFKSFYEKRLFPEGSLYETTRYKAIENFLIFFPKTPIFGTGVHLTDEIREASRDVGSSQIHVGYLSYLVSYGIVGSIFLFGFWFILAKKLYRTAKFTGYWGSFFAYLTFFWAQATLVLPSIFFYGLIFALIFDKHFQDKYRENYYLNKKETR